MPALGVGLWLKIVTTGWAQEVHFRIPRYVRVMICVYPRSTATDLVVFKQMDAPRALYLKSHDSQSLWSSSSYMQVEMAILTLWTEDSSKDIYKWEENLCGMLRRRIF